MSTAIINKPRQKNRPPKPENPLDNIEKTNKDKVIIPPERKITGDIFMELKTNNNFLKEANQSAMKTYRKFGPRGENAPQHLFDTFKKLNETRKSSGDLLMRVAYNQGNIKKENYQMVAEFVENFSKCLVLEEYYLDFFIASYPKHKTQFTELREKIKNLQKNSYALYDRALHEGIKSFFKKRFGKDARTDKSIRNLVDKAFKNNFRPSDAIVAAIDAFQSAYGENPILQKAKKTALDLDSRGSKGSLTRSRARRSARRGASPSGQSFAGAGVVRENSNPLDMFMNYVSQKVKGTPLADVFSKSTALSTSGMPELTPPSVPNKSTALSTSGMPELTPPSEFDEPDGSDVFSDGNVKFMNRLEDLITNFKPLFSNFDSLRHIRLKSKFFKLRPGRSYGKTQDKQGGFDPNLKDMSSSNLQEVMRFLNLFEKTVKNELPNLKKNNFAEVTKAFVDATSTDSKQKREMTIIFYQIGKILSGFHNSLKLILSATEIKGKEIDKALKNKAIGGATRYQRATRRIAKRLSELDKEQ